MFPNWTTSSEGTPSSPIHETAIENEYLFVLYLFYIYEFTPSYHFTAGQLRLGRLNNNNGTQSKRDQALDLVLGSLPRSRDSRLATRPRGCSWPLWFKVVSWL